VITTETRETFRPTPTKRKKGRRRTKFFVTAESYLSAIMKVSDYVLSPTKMFKMLPSDVIVLLLITLSIPSSQPKTFEYRLTQANNIQRQELLQRKCDKYDLGNNELYQNETIHTLSEADLEHLLIDRKHKFLYCYVPKVSFFVY
jgi:hypothetical protein